MAHDLTVLSRVDEVYQNRRGLLGYNKFGRKPLLNTADGQAEVWVGPTVNYNHPPLGSTLYIMSDDDTDDQTILTQGLSEDWELQQAVAALDGQTPVEIPATLWNRVYRDMNPNGTETVGNISIASSNVATDGVPDDLTTVHAFIVAGQQGTQQTPFTIPVGFDGYVTDFNQSLNVSTGGNRVVNIVIEARAFGGIFREVFRGNLSTTGTSFAVGNNPFPVHIPEKTDISLLSATNLNGADVSISYTILLVPSGLVPTQTNVTLTQNSATEVLAARQYRESFSLQLQAPGWAWLKFGDTAAKNDGIRIGPWKVWNGARDFGEEFNAWKGSVSVYYEGGSFGKEHTHLPNQTTATLRVIEKAIP